MPTAQSKMEPGNGKPAGPKAMPKPAGRGLDRTIPHWANIPGWPKPPPPVPSQPPAIVPLPETAQPKPTLPLPPPPPPQLFPKASVETESSFDYVDYHHPLPPPQFPPEPPPASVVESAGTSDNDADEPYPKVPPPNNYYAQIRMQEQNHARATRRTCSQAETRKKEWEFATLEVVRAISNLLQDPSVLQYATDKTLSNTWKSREFEMQAYVASILRGARDAGIICGTAVDKGLEILSSGSEVLAHVMSQSYCVLEQGNEAWIPTTPTGETPRTSVPLCTSSDSCWMLGKKGSKNNRDQCVRAAKCLAQYNSDTWSSYGVSIAPGGGFKEFVEQLQKYEDKNADLLTFGFGNDYCKEDSGLKDCEKYIEEALKYRNNAYFGLGNQNDWALQEEEFDARMEPVKKMLCERLPFVYSGTPIFPLMTRKMIKQRDPVTDDWKYVEDPQHFDACESNKEHLAVKTEPY